MRLDRHYSLTCDCCIADQPPGAAERGSPTALQISHFDHCVSGTTLTLRITRGEKVSDVFAWLSILLQEHADCTQGRLRPALHDLVRHSEQGPPTNCAHQRKPQECAHLLLLSTWWSLVKETNTTVH